MVLILYMLLLFDLLINIVFFLISMFCVLHWYREPWVFTGIGTEY